MEIAGEIVSTGRKPAKGQLTEKHGRYLRQLTEEPQIQRQVDEILELIEAE